MKSISALVIGKQWDIVIQRLLHQSFNKMLSKRGEKRTPDVVRALRKRLKLTQVQFGEIFGMTSKKVSAWEHGKAEPTEEQKQKIQSLLKENNEQERETR